MIRARARAAARRRLHRRQPRLGLLRARTPAARRGPERAPGARSSSSGGQGARARRPADRRRSGDLRAPRRHLPAASIASARSRPLRGGASALEPREGEQPELLREVRDARSENCGRGEPSARASSPVHRCSGWRSRSPARPRRVPAPRRSPATIRGRPRCSHGLAASAADATRAARQRAARRRRRRPAPARAKQILVRRAPGAPARRGAGSARADARGARHRRRRATSCFAPRTARSRAGEVHAGAARWQVAEPRVSRPRRRRAWCSARRRVDAALRARARLRSCRTASIGVELGDDGGHSSASARLRCGRADCASVERLAERRRRRRCSSALRRLRAARAVSRSRTHRARDPRTARRASSCLAASS